MDSKQLALFSLPGDSSESGATSQKLALDAENALSVAAGAFERYMEQRGFTPNTQQAFRLDLQLMLDYLGSGIPIGHISTASLNAFLSWMADARGVPCSPKTLERRITTLKVFFGWLTEMGALPRDPAAPLIHRSVSAPLPTILTDDQIAALLGTTQRMRQGTGEQKPDPRPHLLVMLILNTGIKKSECTQLVLNHIDLTNPDRPALWVRYGDPSRRHKERRILLPASWPVILQEYRQVYQPSHAIFPWTGRNLEYVITKVAEEAGIARLTFEILRWTCAVRDYVEGMDREALRRKLGLSEISWYEVEPKLALLAQRIPARQ
ncbi:MAG: site-specific integrase [Anaerolineae bacterium]|nr:site-specific integrase [Anaerolineae bacterium]